MCSLCTTICLEKQFLPFLGINRRNIVCLAKHELSMLDLLSEWRRDILEHTPIFDNIVGHSQYRTPMLMILMFYVRILFCRALKFLGTNRTL